MNVADLTPEAIDVLRVQIMDQLDAAREHLNEMALAAALPGGNDGPMLEAEKDVERLERKLQGLAHGRKRAEAVQHEREAAARAARRREDAVEVLSLIHQRYWATEKLDEALDAVGAAIADIESLGHQITLLAGGHFGSGKTDSFRNFLLNIDLLDMSDTATRASEKIGKPGRFAKGLPVARPSALRALANALPEVDDEAVKAEALTLARGEAARDG